MLKLAAKEGSDIDWISIKYNLPCGLLSFGLRAVLDVLPTRDNLIKVLFIMYQTSTQ